MTVAAKSPDQFWFSISRTLEEALFAMTTAWLVAVRRLRTPSARKCCCDKRLGQQWRAVTRSLVGIPSTDRRWYVLPCLEAELLGEEGTRLRVLLSAPVEQTS
jgi:hypothetical protein